MSHKNWSEHPVSLLFKKNRKPSERQEVAVMEIPAWWFFSFWALISITFLHLGFYAMDKTVLSNPVPPVVMSLFKHSLASYALIFRPLPRLSTEGRYLWVTWGGFAILL
ncbi:UNVERIFIED_CONTAM: hypothetical protein Sradi_4966200 [Sesamum radiatum]|uniref:Uncharacterized protein n=1 Tax=Sesamum radiatum TaxID=300843 RepID=A0AAW2MEJ7_SESRA